MERGPFNLLVIFIIVVKRRKIKDDFLFGAFKCEQSFAPYRRSLMGFIVYKICLEM